MGYGFEFVYDEEDVWADIHIEVRKRGSVFSLKDAKLRIRHKKKEGNASSKLCTPDLRTLFRREL